MAVERGIVSHYYISVIRNFVSLFRTQCVFCFQFSISIFILAKGSHRAKEFFLQTIFLRSGWNMQHIAEYSCL